MTGEALLIVEDDESLRRVLEAQLKRLGYEPATAADGEQAIEAMHRAHQSLVITDLNLPDINGIELLNRIRSEFPGTPVIVMTAFGTVQTAVDAMKAGAYDYITKPFHPYDLKALVSRALNHRPLEQTPGLRAYLKEKVGFEQIIGSSASLCRALDMAARVASTDAIVLIRGETGTGKELVAKAIHLQSSRQGRAFVTVNCGAIPSELLESELFGHTKGSFTGALADKRGKVEMANHGTLFLDEIGELQLGLQVRILRLIQEREIEKIGASVPVKVDVRIIAATHRNLEAMVVDGLFREDLYYRLLVVPIELPPLRDRVRDIPELVHHFFQKYTVKHAKDHLRLPEDLMANFTNYHWPGNVRQLENSIERIVLLSGDEAITANELPDFLRDPRAKAEILPADLPDAGVNIEAVEKELLLRALRKFGGNQTRAARFLNLSRRALSYRLHKHGLESRQTPETVQERK
jgi:two-component system NtrC family response regulator